MNSSNLKDVYRIFNTLFNEEIIFALGGYYSLIRQGVLKETRPINDLDINVICDNGKLMSNSFIPVKIINDLYVLKNCFRDSNSPFFLKFEGVKRAEYNEGESVEVDENDIVDGELTPPKSNPETEACKSFTLTLINKEEEIERIKRLNEERERRGRERQEILRAELTGLSELSGIYGFGIREPSFYWSGTADSVTTTSSFIGSQYYETPPPPSLIQKKEPPLISIDIDSVIKFERSKIVEPMTELIMSANNSLKIDFFLINQGRNGEKTVKIGDENFASYYPILFAKHKYCTEKFTPQASFEKHINDLVESYKMKRIKGINYPEDIEYLINNWRIIHEETK